MRVIDSTKKMFILLSGLRLESNFSISNEIELQSADTSHIDFATAVSTCSNPNDIAVVLAATPYITAQFHITAVSSSERAVTAWNSSWDAILLSAIFHTEVGFNLQSDTSANEIDSSSKLFATNYHLRGLYTKNPHLITDEDSQWLKTHFLNASLLMKNDKFNTAAYSLATYRWNIVPRIKMAVIWSGIESIFGASSEIRFRLSIYISRFLYPDDAEKRQETYQLVKKLYSERSTAVHGGKLKKSLNLAIEQSSDILYLLVRQCIELNSLPIESDLVP